MDQPSNESTQTTDETEVCVFMSYDELINAFEKYKEKTKTGWRCFKSVTNFSKAAKDILEHTSVSRVRWQTEGKEGISVPFDGIPFINVGVKIFACHQGPDYDIKKKEKWKQAVVEKQGHDHSFQKYRKLVQSSKKLGCQSRIYMSRILKFPDFKVDLTSSEYRHDRHTRQMTKMLREALHAGTKITCQDMFLLKLCRTDSHQFHAMDGEIANLREPIDPKIVNKIKDLYHIGVTSVKEVQRHLQSFVANELFRGEHPPTKTRRRFFPMENDVRNILSAEKAGDKKVPDDQLNLEIKCQDWKAKKPLDFIHCQPSTSNKEKFVFVYQAKWMKRLLLLYGQDMCLMDATYRVCRYALPLFFLCVRTNFQYIVVAVFIIENEDMQSISNALHILKVENPEWNPKNMMMDFSAAEMGAIELCFPGTHIHTCDFHREKAWNEWLSKASHGTLATKADVLKHLREIAQSCDQVELGEKIASFKNSDPYKLSDSLRNYFDKFWGKHLEKWVRCYREEKLCVAIYTNNGIERQNNWLKSTYLENKKNSSLTDLIDILLEQFLPDSYKKYCQLNLQSSNQYRKYNECVPHFLHNRPKTLVKHVMDRMNIPFPASSVEKVDSNLFMVKSQSKDVKYQVSLGSMDDLPSCQCRDFHIYRMLCKHLCTVIKQQGIGWEALGSSFSSYPLYTLDSSVLSVTDASNQPTETSLNKSYCCQESVILPSVTESTLPSKGEMKTKCGIGKKRSQCLQLLKNLTDDLYIVNDETTLDKVFSCMTDMLSFVRGRLTRENGLPLKNKLLSPQKPKVSKVIKRKVSIATRITRRLPQRTRVKASKRYGISAERKKWQAIGMKGLSPLKQDLNKPWLKIGSVTLTDTMRDIITSGGWLNDEHVNAAQILLQQDGTGIGGLNNVLSLKYWKLLPLNPDDYQAVQCHNIGSHWVTSTTVYNTVVVYESLGVNLNVELIKQLQQLYKNYQDRNGMLSIEVIEQQRQTGGSDCGLFCIANATAVVNGVDPTSVVWTQNQMRQHLISCLQGNKMSIFPHRQDERVCNRRSYKVKMV